MKEKQNYAGMDLLLLGCPGGEGTKALVRGERERLAGRLPEDFLEGIEGWETPSVTEEDLKEETGAALIQPLGEGGLFAALWELSRRVDAGFCLDLKEVLLHQETVEVCEVFGLNPYRLLSGGCFLLLSEDGSRLLWQYRENSGLFQRCRESGFPLRMVGKMSENRDKKLYYGERVGYLNRPEPDEWVRFQERKERESK